MARAWKRPFGERGKAAREGSAAKRPGKSVGWSVDRHRGTGWALEESKV